MAVNGRRDGLDDSLADPRVPRQAPDLFFVLVRQRLGGVPVALSQQVVGDDVGVEHGKSGSDVQAGFKVRGEDTGDLHLVTRPGLIDQVVE